MKLINFMFCFKIWLYCINSIELFYIMDWGLYVELNVDILRICWYSCYVLMKVLVYLILFCCISFVFKSRWNDGENGKFLLERYFVNFFCLF